MSIYFCRTFYAPHKTIQFEHDPPLSSQQSSPPTTLDPPVTQLPGQSFGGISPSFYQVPLETTIIVSEGWPASGWNPLPEWLHSTRWPPGEQSVKISIAHQYQNEGYINCGIMTFFYEKYHNP